MPTIGSLALGASGVEWDASASASPESAVFRIRRLQAQKLARFFGTPTPTEDISVPPSIVLADTLDDKDGNLLPPTRPSTPWVNVKGWEA